MRILNVGAFIIIVFLTMVMKRPSRQPHLSKKKATVAALSKKKAEVAALHNKVRRILHARPVRITKKSAMVSTLAKILSCSNLLHGIQAEVNFLPGGNELVRVPDSIGMLRQGSVYMVDCRFDDCSEGGKCLDDYASCELQKAKLVGSQKEFENLVKRCTLSRTMKRLVEGMLTFNSEATHSD